MNDSDISKHYFNDIDFLGNLNLERVLISFEHEPILFLCTDEQGLLYLCLCSEIRYGSWWVIGRISMDALDELLEGRMDIRTAFLENELSYRVHSEVQGKETCEEVPTVNLLETDIPKEGVFYEGDEYLC